MNHSDQVTFDALFAPRTIALVGASGDPKKHTSRPLRMLRSHGYQGRIVPINPNHKEILGEQAYASLLEVPGHIDHAFIMVARDAVLNTVAQCVARQVTVATIYTDGFAETGAEGERLQAELVALARQGGVRLLGPNCSGIYSTRPSCGLSVNAAIEQLNVRSGPLAVISQSGSMTGGLLSRGLGRGVGFSKVVSIGNECDISVGELVDWLVDDPETGAVLLFLESLASAPRLAAAARRAVQAGKPVIVYKMGRSDLGRDLAASHTGAMAGSDEVADAFFRAHGILRVDNIESLFELPVMLAGQRPAKRHRVAIMSTTGGGAGMVADRLGTHQVDVVPPSAEVVARLAQKNLTITQARLTDLTHAGTQPHVYATVLNELLASDHCDLVLAVAGSSAQFQPEISVGPLLKADRHGKPLAVFLAPHAATGLEQLSAGGIAGFRTPESCADAIRAWSRWTAPVEFPPPGKRVKAAAKLLSELGQRRLNESECGAVFDLLGIRVAASQVISDPAQPTRLTFPVVAKVLCADIPHKTEAGGVVLNIGNPEALRTAAVLILEKVGAYLPDAKIDGILVQQMQRGLAEVILGFRRDPAIGPVVVLGAGGVLAEVYKDISIRVAPVALEEAHAMIEEVRGLAVIRGYRGLPRGDCAALAHAIVAMSQLGALDDASVVEAEINPLLVLAEGQGVVAVDGLIVPAATTTMQAR